jgi:hypothetical protein
VGATYNLNAGSANNGFIRYSEPSDYYRVYIGQNLPGNAYISAYNIEGLGQNGFYSWDGGYFRWTGRFYGGESGPAAEAISNGSVVRTWTGGVGGYVSWKYYAPGAPSVTTSTRSSNGTTLRVIGGGGSGRITYYNVALDRGTSWNPNDTSFTVNANETYYSRVLAGNEDASTEGTRVISYGIPTTPTSLSATRSTTTSGSIGISWAAPSYTGAGITSYRLYRDSVAISTSNVTSFSDTTGTPGQTYTYRVTAVNSTGEGNSSGNVTAMAPGSPSAPVSITMSQKIGRTLTITYGNSALNYGNSITEYRMQLSTDAGDTWKGWDNTSKSFTANNTYNTVTANTFTYQLLTPALTYLWRVYAINSIVTAGATPNYRTTSVATFVPSGGKRLVGETWTPTATSKRYNSITSAWIDITTAKRYLDGNWVELS